MHVRYPNPMARFFCGMGLSVLLVSPAARPLLDQVVASAFADEAAPCRSVEVAPELLALADWPLDKGQSEICRSGADSIADDDLARPVELAGNEPIPTVLAEGYETPGLPPKPPGDSIRRRLGRRELALDDRALDDIRGGFEPPDTNLKFSFGIERAVYINGQLVASTVLNLRDLQGASGAGVTPASVDASGLLVVQNGGGNAFQVQVGPSAYGTVIQNTLDNQRIQSVTTINAAVNSAQILRAISVQSAIHDGLVNSLRR